MGSMNVWTGRINPVFCVVYFFLWSNLTFPSASSSPASLANSCAIRELDSPPYEGQSWALDLDNQKYATQVEAVACGGRVLRLLDNT